MCLHAGLGSFLRGLSLMCQHDSGTAEKGFVGILEALLVWKAYPRLPDRIARCDLLWHGSNGISRCYIITVSCRLSIAVGLGRAPYEHVLVTVDERGAFNNSTHP